MELDDIAVGRLAAGKARKIRGRIIHDERIDHEGVGGRIHARHGSKNLQRSGRRVTLDFRVAVMVPSAAVRPLTSTKSATLSPVMSAV